MASDKDTSMPAREMPPSARPAAARTGGAARFYLTNEFGLVCLIVVFGALFALLAKNFLSPFNLFALGRVAAVNAMIGFSMMAVIVTGGLNLAVGAIGVCGAMICGFLIQTLGLPWPIAVLGGLALGSALGFVNGYAVVRSGLHSFIITLATMSIFFGAMVFLTRAESFRDLPEVFPPSERAACSGSCRRS